MYSYLKMRKEKVEQLLKTGTEENKDDNKV